MTLYEQAVADIFNGEAPNPNVYLATWRFSTIAANWDSFIADKAIDWSNEYNLSKLDEMCEYLAEDKVDEDQQVRHRCALDSMAYSKEMPLKLREIVQKNRVYAIGKPSDLCNRPKNLAVSDSGLFSKVQQSRQVGSTHLLSQESNKNDVGSSIELT